MEFYTMTVRANFNLNTNEVFNTFDIVAEETKKSLDALKNRAWDYYIALQRHLENMGYNYNPTKVFHTTLQDGNEYYEDFEYDDDITFFAITIKG